MKYYYEDAITKGLSYGEAKRQAKELQPYYITRAEWNGVHFYNMYGDYCILLESGEVIINPSEVYDTDKDDWMVVVITKEALDLIEKYTKISNVEKVIVKGIRFEYDPNTFEVTDEIMKVLENFDHEEDETCFYMYYDEGGMLVIY